MFFSAALKHVSVEAYHAPPHPAPVWGNLACVVGSPPIFPREQQILFRKRFMDFQTDEEIMRLVDDSVRSWTTGQYDDFQQKTNGYLK